MSTKRGKLRIGTSGYHYAHWRGAFYPRHLPQQCWFAYYARHFDTVALNNTFYRLPPPQTFETWREQAHHRRLGLPAVSWGLLWWELYASGPQRPGQADCAVPG